MEESVPPFKGEREREREREMVRKSLQQPSTPTHLQDREGPNGVTGTVLGERDVEPGAL